MAYILICCATGFWCMIGFFFSGLYELPVMAKLFVQSVKCPTCGHANDFDFRFSQRCGFKRKVIPIINSGLARK